MKIYMFNHFNFGLSVKVNDTFKIQFFEFFFFSKIVNNGKKLKIITLKGTYLRMYARGCGR